MKKVCLKVQSYLVRELKMVVTPTVQFLICCWMIVSLAYGLLDVSFYPLYMQEFFVLLWGIGCGVVYCFFKYLPQSKNKLFFCVIMLLLFIIINDGMYFCIIKGIEEGE